jgi:hypothetical protein
MNKVLCCLLLLISCTPDKRVETIPSATSPVVSENPKPKKEPKIDSLSTDEEDDCVFDNNFKGLTSDWMKELKITNFIWVDSLKHAAVPYGQDTVFASQGGCVHFNISLAKKYSHDSPMISDSTFWINEALKLAEEFKMDHYKKMIMGGKIRKSQGAVKIQFYDVDDDDENDNLYYNGIGISEDNGGKRLEMTQYYN